MSKRTIKVGDSVQFDFGNTPVEGKVLEDRGPIGVGGRRLYLISYEMGEGNIYWIELPTSEFEVIEPKKERA